MSLELHLRLAGVLLLLLASLHFALPRELGWKDDLAKLSLVNRQIFLVHVGFIVLLLILMGGLALFYAEDLATPSRLSRVVLGGLAVFWTLRLLTQHFVYDRSLWRGQRRNTVVHVVFTLLWIYLAGVFGYGWWSQQQAAARLGPLPSRSPSPDSGTSAASHGNSPTADGRQKVAPSIAR